MKDIIKKYVLFEHAGSGNHGCEAIVRTTQQILGKGKYYLQTNHPEEDVRYGLDQIANLISIEQNEVPRNSLPGIMMRLQGRLNPQIGYDEREMKFRFKDLLQKDSVALSIGGDNYCYGWIICSMRDKLRFFLSKEIPVVLWGCSVDRTYLDKDVIADLKNYSLITARESLTMEILNEAGIYDTVVACADPAFILPREHVEWNEEILNSENVIGINVSDFMEYYNAYPNATYRNFYRLIRHILDATDDYVVMIPHVRQEGNDDLKPIKQLVKEIGSERLLAVEDDFNCMQLKDIIARCRLFIGCRTHSTIAAYSSGVPTLVVGYSVKAKGICKDLFGDDEGLLVDVRNFQSDDDLLRMYHAFCDRQKEVRERLGNIDTYCKKAYCGKKVLAQLRIYS